jgi:hypothetical protein
VKSVKFSIFALMVCALLMMGTAWGQVDYATASLRGTVTDPNGAVIAGATVTVTNSSTGIARTTKSAGDGSYRFPALAPGQYQIETEAHGFAKALVKSFDLTVGQSALYDAHLKVGAATEVVEVSAENIPLIQTDQSQQANTINLRQVEDLPNINRSFTYDVYTVPGVTNSEAPRAQNPGFTGYLTTGFSIGGSNGRNNLSTIDGGENEYGTGQYRVTNLPVDGIQEYQVNRNAFAAEFGFTDGSAINIVTKSGGAKWHGDAFGYYRNQSTEASNFFNGFTGGGSKASSQHAYMGLSLGGPLVKDKLFFFTSYEYQKLDTPNFGNVGILTAPTVLGISNPNLGNNNPAGNCATQFAATTPDQVCYVNALKASGNPFLVGFGNGISPGLSPLNNPALNTILNRDNGVFNNPDRLHNAIARFDYQGSDRDTVTLRIGYAHNNFTSPLDGIINGTPDSYGLFVRDFSILTSWSRTINPNLLNQVLVQIVPRNRSNAIPFHDNGVNFSLGNLGAGGPGGTSTFGGPALLPYLAHQQRYQFEDNVSWTKGAHTLKFGASYRPANYHVENDLWFNPEFDFKDGILPLFALAPSSPAGPCPPLPPSVQLSPVQCELAKFNLGHGLPISGPSSTNLTAGQSFAFGIPADVIAGFKNPVWQGWGHYFGGYIQDTWKMTSRLTWNAGVRLDVDAEPSPLGTNFYASPRVGFAWDATGDHKTLIRGGAGIYVAPIDVLIPSYGSLLDGSGRYINQVLGVLSPTDPRVPQLWQTAIALGIYPTGHLTPQQFQQFSTVVNPAPPHNVLIPGYDPNAPGATVGYSVIPDYKNPYSFQASFSIDRELVKDLSLELGYNMYHGVHLQMPVETAYSEIPHGSPLCPTAACTDATGGPLYAPTSGQFQHTAYASNGSSIYHGMTASLTKRFSHGLQFQTNYTWSKTIDNTIDFSSFQNWFRPSRIDLFRAVSVFDIPHNFTANAVYVLPFKAGQGALSSILADISLSPTLTMHSGLPFSVRTPSLVNKINGQNVDNNYAMPFLSSRDNNRGAGFYSFDMSFQKALYINRDRGVRMDVIVQGTNLLNHVNFNKVNDVFDINGIPATGTVQTARGPLNLLTGPFTGLHGVVPTNASQLNAPLYYSSADVPRQIQFGLKLAF